MKESKVKSQESGGRGRVSDAPVQEAPPDGGRKRRRRGRDKERRVAEDKERRVSKEKKR